MKSFRAILILTSAAALTACASVTTREESSAAARQSLPDVPKAWAAAQESVGEVEIAWIGALGDETLTALVREAQRNNRNLRAAAANVEKSWALTKQAGAGLKPQANLTGGDAQSGGVTGAGQGRGSANVGLQIGWELDLWGRIRSGQQAAAASAAAVEADYRFSQHSLAAAVARAYFLSIEAGRQADVARKSVDALTATRRIVDVQYKEGMATSQELALSKSDLATANATLTAAEGAQRDALRALEVLLGRYPGADLDLRGDLPATPPTPSAGTPSELLERRPDVVAAERQVAAAFNNLDQAKAARLPAISLTSSIGGSSNELANLLNPANVAWTVGGNLLAPIFDGGARKAQVEASTAEQKQALAAYGQTALGAFQEVETGLDQSVVLREREASLKDAAVEANEALRIAHLRHNEGETDLLDVLTIQQRTFNADSNLVTIERARLEQWVNLNLALGGSWE
jgi:NodT family efflux transporter outer membrane factor (OMF) lipoprotein